MARDETHVEVDGQRVRISSPGKVMFPERGWTKMDVVEHFLAVAPGVARAIADRPCHLKRWPKGVGDEPFYQRRTKPRAGIDTMTLRFHAAHPGSVWVARGAVDAVRMAQLNCLDLHPWPVRAADQDHPDELRLDLDPTPGVDFDDVQAVARSVREVLAEDGLTGWPKTSGSRGLHVHVRIAPRWDFVQVRRAALAIAREVERRDERATSAWWKEQRRGVFIDFNQMARDRTVAAAYSVRHTGYVSAPLTWDEVPRARTEDFPLDRFAEQRWAEAGDVHAGIDDAVGDLTATMARVARDERAGIGDAPWPPHYRKQPGEPTRVAPSRARDETQDGTATGTTPESDDPGRPA